MPPISLSSNMHNQVAPFRHSSEMDQLVPESHHTNEDYQPIRAVLLDRSENKDSVMEQQNLSRTESPHLQQQVARLPQSHALSSDNLVSGRQNEDLGPSHNTQSPNGIDFPGSNNIKSSNINTSSLERLEEHGASLADWNQTTIQRSDNDGCMPRTEEGYEEEGEEYKDGDCSNAPPSSTSSNEMLCRSMMDQGSHHRQPNNIASFTWTNTVMGRHEAEQSLMEYYHRSKQQHQTLQSTEFLLVVGESGSGKTTLCQSLRNVVQQDGGYFLLGKCDCLRRPQPYPAFVAAFTEFTKQVQARPKREMERIRKTVEEAIGEEIYVLIDMIPSLESLLGSTSSGRQSQAKAGEVLQRFVFVFRLFLRAICSSDQPVVLILDDLEYADPCSLNLLGNIVTDAMQEGLIVLATCDSSLAAQDSYLAGKLREFDDPHLRAHIQTIALDNLQADQIQRMLHDAMFMDDRDILASLAETIHSYTNGNVFQMVFFLRWLQCSNLLLLDDDTRCWFWDEDDIRTSVQRQTVREILLDYLRQSSPETMEVLKVAACLGSYLNPKLIEAVMGFPVDAMLREATHRGLLAITIDETDQTESFMFYHDCIQKSVYQYLILDSERDLFHVEIARRLWRKLDSDGLDQHIFVLLSQVNIGSHIITRQKEKNALANLCCHAGRKAAKSSTFRTAAIYLNLGIQLLDETTSWQDEYDLTLALYNAAAEMELCVSKFDRIEHLLNMIFMHARDHRDKIQAFATKVYALGIIGKQQQALDTGINALSGLGEHLPTKFYTAHTIVEISRLQRKLKRKSREQILRLPPMQDDEKLACLTILHLMFLHALFSRPAFCSLVTIRMVKLTLKYGLSAFAAPAFATYGMACAAIGNYEDAFLYGEIGMELLDRFKTSELLPRVYAAYYGVIWAWKYPLQGAQEPLMRAYRIGMQTGDVEFSTLCRSLCTLLGIEGGIPLDEIVRQWNGFQHVMVTKQQQAMYILTVPNVQMVHHFMGLSEDPLGPKGDLIDWDEAFGEANKSGNAVAAFGITMCRMVLKYVFNDYQGAARLATYVDRNMWLMPPTIEVANIVFMNGMIKLAIAREGKMFRRNIRFAKHALKKLRQWAAQTPYNCSDKLLLLEAELASTLGRSELAHHKYVCAVSLSETCGFLFKNALGNERAGRHFLALGNAAEAEKHLRQSCSSYENWAAIAKSRRLREEIEVLFGVGHESLS